MAEIAQTTFSQANPMAAALRASRLQILAIPVVMAIFALIMGNFANSFYLTAATAGVAISLSITGLAILYGQLGLVSLCQFALVGVGGWITLRLGHGFDLPYELNLLIAGIGASIVGIIFGLPALRLRGLYLALVTLMLAGIFQVIITAWNFPDGGDGFIGRAAGAGRQILDKPSLAPTPIAYFYYVVIIVTLGYMLAQWHRNAKPGRAWALIRKGQTTALASGVNILLYKLWSFALAGFLAGVAGGLLAGVAGQLDSRSFGASESLNLFALAVVGGVFNWYGALIAGLLLRFLPAALQDFGAYLSVGIFGAALFQALAMEPTGIAGRLSLIIGWFRKKLLPKGGARD